MMTSHERWIKYYSSSHSILLVGEGDFSFSKCLALHFDCATNITATTLDSYYDLIYKYKYAMFHLELLRIRGASVLHGVDATQMVTHPGLVGKKFDRIIYNFPHAGFFGREDNPHMMMMHTNLVRGFLQSASSMLHFDGEIHISHKTNAPFDSWKIEDLGTEFSLVCVAQDEFRIQDYPGYFNKRGSGFRADEAFPLGACKTFRFKLSPAAATTKALLMPPNPMLLAPQDCASECRRIFGRYLNHVEETFGDTSYDARSSVTDALRLGYTMYAMEVPRRPSSGFTSILEELHRLSVLRSDRLRQMLLHHQINRWGS